MPVEMVRAELLNLPLPRLQAALAVCRPSPRQALNGSNRGRTVSPIFLESHVRSFESMDDPEQPPGV